MSEVKLKDLNQGDLVDYTADQLGVSQERARNIISIHHPNILDVEIEQVQETERTIEEN